MADSVSFTWGPPRDQDCINMNITSYNLTCIPMSDAQDIVTMEYSNDSFTSTFGVQTNVTDFIPGTFYTCLVYATNMAGNSPTASVNLTSESA